MDNPDLNRLLAVVREVHAERADDLCWMDIDRIFAAAGLPVPDRHVGCKVAMKANCERFIDTLCQGGHWPSYRDLEAIVHRVVAAYHGVDDIFDVSEEARRLMRDTDERE